VDDCLAIIGHEADERRVPLVHNFGEGRGARAHQDLADAIVELLNTCTSCQHLVMNIATSVAPHLHPKREGMLELSAPSFVRW
jgi:hypothetical protein